MVINHRWLDSGTTGSTCQQVKCMRLKNSTLFSEPEKITQGGVTMCFPPSNPKGPKNQTFRMSCNCGSQRISSTGNDNVIPRKIKPPILFAIIVWSCKQQAESFYYFFSLGNARSRSKGAGVLPWLENPGIAERNFQAFLYLRLQGSFSNAF